MKHTLAALAATTIAANAATTVANYSAGVTATAGTTGAADPTTQSWSFSGGGNAWATGSDSSIGGWRVTDGTSAALAFYQYDISTADATSMASNSWTATWTVAVNGDAVNGSGGTVDNFYTADSTRQNNNAMWVELAGGAHYVITYENDASGNISVNDGTTSYAITGGVVSEEIAATVTANYITFSLSSDGTLTDSLGGSRSVGTFGTGASDRVLFGSYSGGGMGSTTWNSVNLEVVPEPSSAALLGLGGLTLILRRRK